MALCTQKMSTIISLPEMMDIKKYQQVGWVGNIQGNSIQQETSTLIREARYSNTKLLQK